MARDTIRKLAEAAAEAREIGCPDYRAGFIEGCMAGQREALSAHLDRGTIISNGDGTFRRAA